MDLQTYAFGTVTFTEHRVRLLPHATVFEAKQILSDPMETPPYLLLILQDGQVLSDTDTLEPEGFARKPPIVHRMRPQGSPADDPPNFGLNVEQLLSVVGGSGIDRATVVDVLRAADGDVGSAIDLLFTPAEPATYPDVPTDHMQRLAAKKPPAMSLGRALSIYKEVCAGYIALAEELLPQVESQ
jgi:hypothetical protein